VHDLAPQTFKPKPLPSPQARVDEKLSSGMGTIGGSARGELPGAMKRLEARERTVEELKGEVRF
jgi:hypothetical protein